eukprot:PhF_6_TR5637/c0_g1_i1/m.8218
MKQQLQEQESTIDRQRKEVTDLKGKIGNYEQQTGELSTTLAAKTRQLQQQQQETRDNTSRLENELLEVRNQLTLSKKATQELRVQKEDVEHQRDGLSQELAKTKSTRDVLKTEGEDRAAEIERLTKDIGRISSSLATAERERDEARHQTVEACRMADDESALYEEQLRELEETLEKARTQAVAVNRNALAKIVESIRVLEVSSS